MALHKDLGSEVQFVSVDFEETPDVVSKFGRKLGVDYPLVVGDDRLFEAFDVDAPPINLLLSSTGKILLADEGFDRAAIVKMVRSQESKIGQSGRTGRGNADAASAAHTAGASAHKSGGAAAAAAGKQARGPFPDVPPDHWAAAAVAALQQRGILQGYPDR